MKEDTSAIPITLVLPRYEVMTIMYALKELGNRRYEQAIDSKLNYFRGDGDLIYALANRIFATTREQFVAFETQNEQTPKA